MKLAVNGWFLDQLATGSGQYLRYLLANFPAVDASIEVHLLVPGETIPTDLPPELDYVTIHTLGGGRNNVAKVKFEQRTIPTFAKKIGADLIHIPYWAPPLRSKVPFVVTVHDIIPLLLPEHRGSTVGMMYTSLVSAATRGAAHVITDSHSSRLDVIEHLNIPTERVSTVYLAVTDDYQPSTKLRPAAGIKDKYNLPENYILYIGGFHKRKNVQRILAAWTWASGPVGDFYPLVIAGSLPTPDGKMFYDLPALAEELDITDTVRFIGRVAEEDKIALYQGATGLIFPSSYEGFGLPPLEAMACGIPVITSDKSSLPEVVGDAAYLLPDLEDTRKIASTMIGLTIDEELHSELSAKGVKQAQKFSWQKTAAETIEIYKQVVG